MSFHYALVDDLISREEFDRRVEEKEKEAGGLLDTHTAAMLVVGELGRSHVKIRDITRKASIFSFFGKMLASDPPHHFTRADGSPGILVRCTLGDETGQITAVIWDERALAVQEIGSGDVMEVIGRPSRSGVLEIQVFDLRPSACEIGAVDVPASSVGREEQQGPTDICLLGLEAPREFLRRDGSSATLVEGLIGTTEGTYRFVCWAPGLCADLVPPCTVRVTGMRVKEGARGREFHLDTQGKIEVIESTVNVPFVPLTALSEGEIPAIRGTITALDPPRSFRKDGEFSWLRHMTIMDDRTGRQVVLWEDKARIPLIEGEEVAIYHAHVKKGRGDKMEIHSTKGTVILPLSDTILDLVFEGTVIPGLAGMLLDNGEESYLLEGELPPALHLRVEGQARGRRLLPLRYDVIKPDRNALLSRLSTI